MANLIIVHFFHVATLWCSIALDMPVYLLLKRFYISFIIEFYNCLKKKHCYISLIVEFFVFFKKNSVFHLIHIFI